MKHILFLLIIFLVSCKSETSKPVEHQYTNELVNETSPYLLQHAHNPVNWHAWNDKTLAKAKEENKLILISVGYAACHWCHVMEHESFEDSLVAQVMNKSFINIKVDREERPDIDQVYMNALQLMTGSGGWPMNIIALPDGRPVWGKTYLKKDQWVDALNQVSKIYAEKPEKLIAYADKLEKGIKSLDLITINEEEPVFDKDYIDTIIKKWSNHFDTINGGMKATPKFMMPNNYQFLMRYAYQTDNEALQNFVNTTLTQMAYGGIYDHVGGGFSRYSTDSKWHVPHFEKMLYDNAQLVSLYSDAYLITKNELYKKVVIETLEYINQKMSTENGSFYSSLDADSYNKMGELEEGAFYVWQQEELKTLLNEDFDLFSDYYNINEYGLWENDNYVLIRKEADSTIINKHQITAEVLDQKTRKWKSILFNNRNNRSKPQVDDKTLTSWNALMIKGYIDAYRVFNNDDYLYAAEKNGTFITYNQIRKDGGLNHSYKYGRSTINGYLEDYATTIDAFIALYEVTLNEKWLNSAKKLTDYTLVHFYDDTSKMFFFTSNTDTNLISRSIEYRDNVIPASNSIMAKNLFKLSHYFGDENYKNTSTTMLNNIKPAIKDYISSYSNWLDLMLNYSHPYYEVAIIGNDAKEKLLELNKVYIPNKLIVGSTDENNLPLLENRYNADETLIYVCVNKVCKLPVPDVVNAVLILKE